MSSRLVRRVAQLLVGDAWKLYLRSETHFWETLAMSIRNLDKITDIKVRFLLKIAAIPNLKFLSDRIMQKK